MTRRTIPGLSEATDTVSVNPHAALFELARKDAFPPGLFDASVAFGHTLEQMESPRTKSTETGSLSGSTQQASPWCISLAFGPVRVTEVLFKDQAQLGGY